MKATLFRKSLTLLTPFLLMASSPVWAQGLGGGYLQIIARNTTVMMEALNRLPQTLDKLYFSYWTRTDDDKGTPVTTTMQQNFSWYGQFLATQSNIQTGLLSTLNSDLLNTSVDTAVNISNQRQQAGLGTITPSNLKALPYANDLVYSTLLGSPFAQGKQETRKNVNSPYNYIRNASGMNIFHVIPDTSWQGTPEDVSRYQNYYNSVMSAESFGSYVLSEQYAENKANEENEKKAKSGGDKPPTSIQLRQKLIKQATDSSWSDVIMTESIGFVVRHTLMYISQVFVLLNEQLKVQKQMVTAQVMTNSILIAGNQQTEAVLIMKAKTKP